MLTYYKPLIPIMSSAAFFRAGCYMFLFFLSITAKGQTVFWTENFGTGCNQNQIATAYMGTNGAWTTISTGTNGTSANTWYVSAAENGFAPGTCADGCDDTPGLINRTLHLGNVSTSSAALFFCPTGDCGAMYDASDALSETNSRAVSPSINCSGKTGIELNFSYLHGGDADDYGQVDYFDGSTWSMLSIPLQTSLCGVGLGTWAQLSIALPPSADNNPNVKIGFNWTNNDDGNGNDPSFAIDSIYLTATTGGSALQTAFTVTDSTLCTGQCVSFTDQSTGAPSNWVWSFPGATPSTSILQNPTNICYNTAGVYTVTLRILNVLGIDSLVKTNYINVTNCPGPIANFTASDTTLCIGDCISFNDISTGNPATYAWNFQGATPATAAVANPTGICYNQSGSFTVTLTVTNASGSNTITKTALVDVSNCSGPSANFSANATNICLNDCIDFVNQSSGATSYQWSFPGASPSTSSQVNPTNICYGAVGTYNVQLIAFGGGLSDTLVRNTYITVTACPVPVADFTSSVTGPICRNNCINFFDNSTNIPSSWKWYFPGATPDSAMVQNPLNICYDQEGLYDVMLIVTNQFGTDTIIRYSFIEVKGVTGAGVSPDTTMLWGNSYQLEATGGVAYEWTPATGLSSDSIFDPIATPLQTTNYTVVIYDNFGCSSVRSVTVYILQNNNIFIPTAFSPDGNPNNREFKIYGNNIFDAQLSIFDKWGNKVFQTSTFGVGWDGTYKGEPCVQGVYTWVASVVYEDGKSQSLSGSVALVR